MLRFLALGCDLHAVVKVLSREFGCSQAGVYKDYERMHRWYKHFLRDDALIIIVRMRLEILSQEAFKMVIDESIKNPYAKISALNAALKITKETIKLAKELGLIKPTPTQTSPKVARMPFEFNQVFAQALKESVEQQRLEKYAKIQAMLEKQNPQSVCTA